MLGIDYRKRKFHGHKKQTETNVFVGKSASSKKLKLENSAFLTINSKDKLQGYRIVDIGLLFDELSRFLCCNVCHSTVTYSEEVRGCASVFKFSCAGCKSVKKVNSSPMLGIKKSAPEVNLRLVYSMRCIGQGLAGLKTFCAVMNIPPPISQKSYDNIVRKIKCATKVAAENCMKTASCEEEALTGSSDICISGDGTWKTRGHTSKVGVCSVIGSQSGKVIDVEVLSSFCKACETLPSSNHDCKKNHSGSSGVMEVIGMTRIFQRSETNRNLRYVKYLGDGDTKTFLEISKAQPYGDLKVEKLECIGHVQKRMGTRLRKLKQQLRGEKLPDGKTVGGKGRLTDKLIDKLTVYYGNAIRSNTHSLKSMREAVWATYCHMCSTDAEPMHMFCPKGLESWCAFQKHVANGKDKTEFQHKPSIPIEVMKSMKKVYADLSAPNLLKRCLTGKTQNPNESFNSVIWKFCPKTSGCGRTIVEIAVYEAIICFNEGHSGRLQTLKQLGIQPGLFTVNESVKADLLRVKTAEKRADMQTLEARRCKRMAEKSKNEQLQQKEGITYKPGEF